MNIVDLLRERDLLPRALADLLGLDEPPSGTKAVRCPNAAAHRSGDAHPSAIVEPRAGRLRCAACGLDEGLLDIVQRVESLASKAEAARWLEQHFDLRNNGARAPRLRVVATYPYRDENGALLFEVLRFEPKSFRQRRPDGKGDWAWSLDGVRRVPYRLPELRTANVAHPVCVVEGEKDADRLAALGLVATTNPGGAGKWLDQYSRELKGRHVVILPDADEPGRRHAETVARSVKPHATSVKVIELPNLPAKGDVTDWLDAGGTLPQLGEIVKATPEWEPVPAVAAATASEYESFPSALLPDPLRAFVEQQARAMGLDASFVALPALAVAASLIGNAQEIEPRRGHREPCVLWVAVVGPSGSGKSPAQAAALRSIYQLQAAEHRRYRDALRTWKDGEDEYRRALEEWRCAKSHERPERPTKPTLTTLVLGNTTVEAIVPALRDGPRGVLVAHDELSAMLAGFDAYRKGRGGDAQFFLSAHRAETYIVTRKGGTDEEKSILIPRLAVSIAGGIQLPTLRRMIGKEHRENGLLQRFLLAAPPRPLKKWTDAVVDSDVIESVEVLFKLLRAIPLDIDHNGDPCPRVVPLSSDAARAWRAFFDENAARINSAAGDLYSVFNKMEAACARLALVFATVRRVANGPPMDATAYVEADDVERAAKLTRWFCREAERIYAMLDEEPGASEKRELLEWIRRRGGTTTVRDLMRGPRQYRNDREGAEVALRGLVEDGLAFHDAIGAGNAGGAPVDSFVLRLSASGDGDTTPENLEKTLVPSPSPRSDNGGAPSIARTA